MSTELIPLAVLMGLVTYPFRAVPLLAPGFERLPERARLYLRLVGPSVLAALAAVNTMVIKTEDGQVAALSGHTVVHLHGGLTPASYDGWAESLFAPGQPAVFHYPMDQRAALLWYHDHVMGVTKYDVYAGLAGLWIVRDERERELSLPEGPPFEVPLLIQDRNFDVDDHGRLTGRLVHKTDPDVMEAFPPFTVVNGKVWPVLDVQPATYRFRILNGSNARTYRLVLMREGRPELGRISQIGTDHGLLRSPVAVPADGLVLASAERADLIVDFSDLGPGSELTLLNTAAAPFDGTHFPAADALNAANLDGLLPYPQVMRFRVTDGHVTGPKIPRKLATDGRRRVADRRAGRPRLGGTARSRRPPQPVDRQVGRGVGSGGSVGGRRS